MSSNGLSLQGYSVLNQTTIKGATVFPGVVCLGGAVKMMEANVTNGAVIEMSKKTLCSCIAEYLLDIY